MQCCQDSILLLLVMTQHRMTDYDLPPQQCQLITAGSSAIGSESYGFTNKLVMTLKSLGARTVVGELKVEVWVILHNHEVILAAGLIQSLPPLQWGNIADWVLAIGY